ncbi:hypothetical protein [Saccharibacillus kuerlensis]|uniref:Uncharacterized protein n=1 Tax=Saccharibacillus kuerlensis TaxID=459527 RepID=A0ABQ2L776_9BACL|nr:hypothetical protein [Saccharibacillus kuerlensis]GGO03802.1 hypothetical protein GCM10010969_28360 [Saccharibacillus kuerlensis]
MEEPLKIYVLLKFGEKRFMEKFQRGQLHFQCLSAFKNPEPDESGRNDQFEAASVIYNPGNYKVYVGGKQLEDIEGPIVLQENEADRQYSLSLYGITNELVQRHVEGEQEHLIHPWNEKFGDYAVVVTNPKEFRDRIDAACRRGGFGLREGMVEYHEVENFTGRWGYFRKPKEYEYQSEYRLLLDQETEAEDYTLDIGDISDISEIGSFHDLIPRIRVKIREEGGTLPREDEEGKKV